MAGEVFASGVATAPSAGAAVATMAAQPAGKYRIEVSCGVSGNAVADLANFRLRRGGVDLIAILPQGANGTAEQTILDEVDLDGTQNLTVEAIGAGTAAIEYTATIQALRIG